MMYRPIAISLSPNTEKDDVLLAFKVLFSPLSWFDERSTAKLEQAFAKDFGINYHALAVNSGRGALYLILKALGVGKGDEVLLQALTCVAVPNSVRWAQAKPIYVDVDESFNIDPADLNKKITGKTKAIIVQHTFGIPAQIDSIMKIAKKRGIFVIEDCALSLGAKYKGKPVGTFGDVSFFSFGRDKVISSVFGGMILCSSKEAYRKLTEERNKLPLPGRFWVIQQLLHPILFSLILLFYNFGKGKFSLGKIMLYFFQKIGLLSKAIYAEEKKGNKPHIFPAKLPGALSVLALNQLKKTARFNKKRQAIADIYRKELEDSDFKVTPKNSGAVWVRFPIFSKEAGRIFEIAKKKGILLGNWYKKVVEPVHDLAVVNYIPGSCPKAEKYSGNILNLPTYPAMTIRQVEQVIQLIK